MRILWAKANKLLPVHSGGDIRSYQIARYLASRHELTFLSYYGGQADPGYEDELRREFPGAVCLWTRTPERSTLGGVLDYVMCLPLAAPYSVSRFASSVVRDTLKDWFDRGCFDVAVCDFLDAAVNFPRELTTPSVLFQHNVETEIWRRHVLSDGNKFRKLIYGTEFIKMLRYEQRTLKRFHHVIAVSEHDRSLMASWADPSRITVVPTGVDLDLYRFEGISRVSEPLVVFVGAMDWEPNIDAADYFCQEIWPSIQDALPEARFRIVGREPDRRVLKLASSSVEVTGRVPSVTEHLGQAAVVIVPLRIGGGTRLKIYEAMAMGKVVVSTSVGAEGLDVHHGQDIVLADDPRLFAEAVVNLLENPDLRARYGQSAAKLASQYGWPAIGKRFEEVLEDAVSRSKDSTQRVGA